MSLGSDLNSATSGNQHMTHYVVCEDGSGGLYDDQNNGHECDVYLGAVGYNQLVQNASDNWAVEHMPIREL